MVENQAQGYFSVCLMSLELVSGTPDTDAEVGTFCLFCVLIPTQHTLRDSLLFDGTEDVPGTWGGV